MIDFPLDLAVNSGITAAVVGVFLLLPPGWLLTPSLRQRLFTGTLLGLASVVAMYWNVLAGLSPMAELRPAYLTLALYIMGRRVGLIALVPALLAAVILRAPSADTQMLLIFMLMAWADVCRQLLRRERSKASPRVRVWLSLLMLAAGVQALMLLASQLGWLSDQSHAQLWRYGGSTLLLGCCLELMVGRVRYEL